MDSRTLRRERLAVALADRYEFLEPIGQGGFASVYKVRNLRLRRLEALKVLAEEDLSENSEFAQRFEQEARVSASLDHPNIVKIYDYGVIDGIAWFSMQLIEGRALATRLHRSTERMTEADAAAIAVPVLDALEYSHSRGVVHRDIKPDNIMLDARGRPYLTDFGIAKAEDSAVKTRAGFLMGSPAYMAPEQIRSGKIDGRTDLYSLGITLYKMLARSFPFTADDTFGAAMKKLEQPPEPLLKKRPDLHPDFEAIVMKALARDPAERFGTAIEMRAAFESYFDVFGMKDRGTGGRTPRPAAFPWERTPAGMTPGFGSKPSDPKTAMPVSPSDSVDPTRKLHTPGATVRTPVERSSEASRPVATSQPTEGTRAASDRLTPAGLPPPSTLPKPEKRYAWKNRAPLFLVIAVFASVIFWILHSVRKGDVPPPNPSEPTAAARSDPSPIASPVIPTVAPPAILPEPAPSVAPPATAAPRPTPAPRVRATLVPNLPGSDSAPTLQFSYCASLDPTTYRQGAVSELPAGFIKEQGDLFRGPRTDAARIIIKILTSPRQPRDGEQFEITAILENGGDTNLIVSRVDESTPREAGGFAPVAGLKLPISVSAGGLIAIYRSTSALNGGGTYHKQLRVTDSFGDSWRAAVDLRPCPSP